MSLQRRLQLVGDSQENLWVSRALKIAFASTDMKHVDQHFGTARAFAFYALDKEHSCFLEACEFGDLLMDGNEDKLTEKLRALEGCSAVYSLAIGASAVKQLKARYIHPLKVPAGREILALLNTLQQELIQSKAGWLAQAVARTKPADLSRFDAMADEDWEE